MCDSSKKSENIVYILKNLSETISKKELFKIIRESGLTDDELKATLGSLSHNSDNSDGLSEFDKIYQQAESDDLYNMFDYIFEDIFKKCQESPPPLKEATEATEKTGNKSNLDADQTKRQQSRWSKHPDEAFIQGLKKSSIPQSRFKDKIDEEKFQTIMSELEQSFEQKLNTLSIEVIEGLKEQTPSSLESVREMAKMFSLFVNLKGIFPLTHEQSDKDQNSEILQNLDNEKKKVGNSTYFSQIAAG